MIHKTFAMDTQVLVTGRFYEAVFNQHEHEQPINYSKMFIKGNQLSV